MKAFLDFMDIPYDIVEVNPIFKKELKSLEEGAPCPPPPPSPLPPPARSHTHAVWPSAIVHCS